MACPTSLPSSTISCTGSRTCPKRCVSTPRPGSLHTPTRRGAMSFAVDVTDAAACGDTAWRRSSPPPEGRDVSFREVFLPDAPSPTIRPASRSSPSTSRPLHPGAPRSPGDRHPDRRSGALSLLALHPPGRPGRGHGGSPPRRPRGPHRRRRHHGPGNRDRGTRLPQRVTPHMPSRPPPPPGRRRDPSVSSVPMAVCAPRICPLGAHIQDHGAGAKNTQALTDRARSTGNQQGQWLDNDAAAEFLRGIHVEGAGPRSVQIPEGMGQVIMPDGSIVQARAATVVPSRNGLYKTGFPIIGPN